MEKQYEVYVNDVFTGMASDKKLSAIISRIKTMTFSYEIDLWGHAAAVRFAVGHRSPEALRLAIQIMDGETEPDIAHAARAFEQAINSDPDLRVEAHRIETTTLGDEVSRCVTRIFVTRETSEQVYP